MTYIDTNGQMHDDGCFKPPKCEKCRWYCAVTLDCLHDAALYKTRYCGEVIDNRHFATTMRKRVMLCGLEGKLFEPRETGEGE
jgi:hypothetical protein